MEECQTGHLRKKRLNTSAQEYISRELIHYLSPLSPGCSMISQQSPRQEKNFRRASLAIYVDFDWLRHCQAAKDLVLKFLHSGVKDLLFLFLINELRCGETLSILQIVSVLRNRQHHFLVECVALRLPVLMKGTSGVI